MYLARKLPAPSSLLRRYKSTISHPDRFFCPRRSLSRETWPLIDNKLLTNSKATSSSTIYEGKGNPFKAVERLASYGYDFSERKQ
jgi:hypothetical protein